MLLALGVPVAGGCASGHTTAPSVEGPPAAVPAGYAATAPATVPESLHLDELKPLPVFAAPRALRTAEAPLDALELFARARAAANEADSARAIALLHQAIELDPDSYELFFSLGELEAYSDRDSDRALEAFTSAAAIRPDDVAVQLWLGRLYFIRKNYPKAIEHLRLARHAHDFESIEARAALCDALLARALTQQGNLQAAVDAYQQLLSRLSGVSVSSRTNPELSRLVEHPEVVHIEIAELLTSLKRTDAAVQAYEAAIRLHGQGNLELQVQYARALLADGQLHAAQKQAVELVSRFHARPETIALIQEVFGASGQNDLAIDQLVNLQRAHPQDQAILFALSDMLLSKGRQEQATAVLSQAASHMPGNLDLIRRLFSIYDRNNQTSPAAVLLVNSLGARPDLLVDLAPLFSDLLRPMRRGYLRLDELRSLKVSPDAQGAQWYWVSKVADLWGRGELSQSAMQRAAAGNPPFDPAYRELLARQWGRNDLSQTQKIAASEQLAQQAAQAGRKDLADEITALSLVRQGQIERAQEIFSHLALRADASYDVQMEYAQILAGMKRVSQTEKTLWRLISDYPTRDKAYQMLFGYYLQQRAPAQAMKVLNTWLSADPASMDAQLLQTSVLASTGNVPAAMRLVDRLFDTHPDNARLLEAMAALYQQAEQLPQLLTMFQQQWTQHPENWTLGEQLVRLYIGQSRRSDAQRVLESMQKIARDPDLLYSITGLYYAMGDQQATEKVLLEVLQINPDFPPANNDLAYFWTQDNRNLSRSEAMVRKALSAEPDNQSYLDTLGWVQYMRGHMDEARASFERAIGNAAHPDSVILDHLADTLYRLGQTDQAAKLWQQSLKQITDGQQPDRPELQALLLSLQKKLAQVKANQPASVAPTSSELNAGD